MVIKKSKIWPRVLAWVSANGLTPEVSEKYPMHDIVHVFFELSHEEEGIVMAIEECISTGNLLGMHDFIDLALSVALDGTDNYTAYECANAFDKLAQNWPVTIDLNS